MVRLKEIEKTLDELQNLVDSIGDDIKPQFRQRKRFQDKVFKLGGLVADF